MKEIERGEIVPDSFMDGITAMLGELMQTYKPIPGAEVLFPSGREMVGKCPRCKADVTETPKGFFCENRACSFALWKNSKFFTAKKKTLTKTLADTLLKDGRAPLKGCYSEKTGNTLAEMFSTTANKAPDAAVPAEPQLTLEQVIAVLADKSRMGFTAEIRTPLQKYGAAKLSGIDPVHYKALVAEAEVLGDGN